MIAETQVHTGKNENIKYKDTPWGTERNNSSYVINYSSK